MTSGRKLLIGIVLVVLLAGSVGYLIFKQNRLSSENERFQQAYLSQQAEMIEAIRKSSLIPLMSNLLDKIDDELSENPQRTLSDETIARISALSYSFTPYTLFNRDTVPPVKLSPERGQLLLVLSRMRLDTVTLGRIMYQTSFSGADLRSADFRSADLRGIDLNGADLSNANLEGALLRGAQLKHSNLWGANLKSADLREADLKRAILSWANLNDVNASKANLSGADLTSAQMRKINLEKAIIQWANMTGVFLHGARLDSTDLYGTNLQRAYLKSSNLSHARLLETNLVNADLNEADLSEVNLTNAIVNNENWIDQLNNSSVKGASVIKNKYVVSRAELARQSVYLVKKIEQ